MAEQLGIYKCEVCGNIVEMMHVGGGSLVCCGKEMKLLKPTTTDGNVEKHVPVIEKIDGGFKVKVGAVAHPMNEEHHIEWVELLVGDQVFTQFLSPGDTAFALFQVEGEKAEARTYCNQHGHWKNT